MNEQLIEKLQQINNELQAYPIDFCISTSLSREETNVLLQALTSVKSEPPQTDKLYELSIERYGNDVHLYAQQREGFVEGYAQAIRNLAPIVNPTPSVKSESAEEYKTQVVIPIQIKHKNYCDLNGKIIPTEFILDKEHFFYGGYGYIVLHDFANNSEAMKENAIGFLEWYSMNRYYQMASSVMHTKIGDKNIYTENKLYTIYKESKFASFN